MAEREIQSWLWVAIMVVISIVANIRKNRKSAELEQTPPPHEEEEEDEMYQEPQREEDFWPEYKSTHTPAPFLEVEVKSDVPVEVKEQLPVAPPIQAIEEEGASIPFDDADEIKKAVIYSEIFNRKF